MCVTGAKDCCGGGGCSVRCADKWGVQWWGRRGGGRILAITNKNERCNERRTYRHAARHRGPRTAATTTPTADNGTKI